MRPKSIVNFERIVLLSILIGIVNNYLTWDRMQAAMAQAQHGKVVMGSNVIIGIQVVVICIYLLLIWFITRKGSPVAKWIYVVLCLLGLIFGIIGLPQMRTYGTASLLLAIVQYTLAIASLWLLFRPDSKAWFSEGRGPDPDALT